MTKLNEKEIISIFQKKLENHRFVSEDVEIFRIGKTNCVTKVDTLVESTDIPPGMKLKDAARKSVVACVSDFASKGVKPLYGMISITIPKKFSKLKITDLAIGLGKAAKEFDLRFIGGDTNEGKELVLQVSLFGSAKKIVARKGAKTNNEIVATVNPVNISRVKSNAKAQKIPLFEIGYVTNGVGVMYKMGTKTIPIKDKGWLHFGS